jgi:hypothetical protein
MSFKCSFLGLNIHYDGDSEERNPIAHVED